MTMFFMLSGFSLFVNWAGSDLFEIPQIKIFIKKRFFSIVPMYYIACILFVVLSLSTKKEQIWEVILLAPVETMGFQSVFSSLFSYSHNGGTWFISCLLICYFLYPYIQELIKNTNKKTREVMLLLCVFVLLYSPFVVFLFKIKSIYSNPFFRLLEFIIGILLAAMTLDYEGNEKRFVYNWYIVIIANLMIVIGISLGVSLNVDVGNYMLYSWIYLPCFIVTLIGLSGVESNILNNSKLLKLMSQVTFVFFLAQLYSNQICKMLIKKYEIESNLIRILIGWSMCIIITVGLRLIEITLNKLYKKYAIL